MTAARPGLPLLLAVAAGGALGGTLRWWLGDLVPDGEGFPCTTFAINVTGSLALAALPALAAVRRRPLLTVGLGPGVLGGYTTLSTYAEQGRALLADGRAGLAAAYLVGTLAACPGRGLARRPPDLAVGAAGVRRRGRQRVTPLLVAAGAGLGALLRFWVAHHLDGRTPWGTLLVNVAGSFVLGLVVGAQPSPGAVALLGAGFCGGLTTYSAFAVQTRDQGRGRGGRVRRRDRAARRRCLRAGVRDIRWLRRAVRPATRARMWHPRARIHSAPGFVTPMALARRPSTGGAGQA